jgi:thiopurine S-methyltransferase
LEDVNPLLIKFWDKLKPSREDDVFVPLCGKSEDLIWLAQQHNSVQGVELSQIAVRAFFAEHLYTPMVTPINSQFELYQFDELDIYVGDYFTAPIKPVDLIYDRAALIAIPQELRVPYVNKLKQTLKPGGRILLVTLDYAQSEMTGPPFSVPSNNISAYFGDDFKLTLLNRDEADSNHPRIQQGLTRFSEEVWLVEHQK